MWRGLLKYGSRVLNTAWRGIKSGSAWVASFFTGGSAGKAGAFRRFGGWAWKALNIGFIGYEVFDFFTDDDDDIAGGRATDLVMESILSQPVIAALQLPFSDLDAVSYSFSNLGLRFMTSDNNMDVLRGLSYISCAEYIAKTGNPGRMLYSAETIEETLTTTAEAIAGLLGEESVDPDTGDPVNVADTMKEFFDAIEFGALPVEVLKNYDYLTFFFSSLDELVTDEENSQAAGQTTIQIESPEAGTPTINFSELQ